MVSADQPWSASTNCVGSESQAEQKNKVIFWKHEKIKASAKLGMDMDLHACAPWSHGASRSSFYQF